MAVVALGRQAGAAAGGEAVRVASCAALALALWMFTRPFNFVHTDGHLYAFLALAWADPQRFAGDLFIRFGSQDSYSLFSPIYGSLVRAIGLEAATVLLQLAGGALWLFGSWRLAHALMTAERARLAVLLLAAVTINYGGFSALVTGEGVLTGRIFAEGFGLLALAQAVRGRWVSGAGFWLVAATLHPLMALGPAGIAYLMAAIRTPRLLWLALIGGVGGLALAGLGVSPFNRLLTAYDPEWLRIVENRNGFVFIGQWPAKDWSNLALQLVVVGFAAWRSEGLVRHFLVAVAVAAVAGLAASWIGADLAKNVLVTQLQLWRCAWPLAWAALPAAAIVVQRGRMSGWATPVLFVGALAVAQAPLSQLLMGAGLATAFLDDRRALQRATVIAGLSVLAAEIGGRLFVWGRVWKYAGEHAIPLHELFNMRLDGWIVAAPLVLVALLPARALLPLTAGVLAVSAMTWDQRSDWTRFSMRGPPPAPLAGEVLWSNGAANAWFLMRTPAFVSRPQGAGLLFSRETALTWVERAGQTRGLVSPRPWAAVKTSLPCTDFAPRLQAADLHAICQAADHPDWVITRAPIDLPALTFHTPAPEGEICSVGDNLEWRETSTFYAYRC